MASRFPTSYKGRRRHSFVRSRKNLFRFRSVSFVLPDKKTTWKKANTTNMCEQKRRKIFGPESQMKFHQHLTSLLFINFKIQSLAWWNKKSAAVFRWNFHRCASTQPAVCWHFSNQGWKQMCPKSPGKTVKNTVEQKLFHTFSATKVRACLNAGNNIQTIPLLSHRKRRSFHHCYLHGNSVVFCRVQSEKNARRILWTQSSCDRGTF